jgi:Flp pilus assembly protein TadD
LLQQSPPRFVIQDELDLAQALDLARAALKSNQPAEAAERCQAVLAASPGLPAARELLAAALLALDHPELAEEHAVAALAADPDNPDLLSLDGKVLAKLERWQEAADRHRAALELAPGRPDLMTDLGIALFELDQFGPALALFRQAFQLAPTDARVVANLGNFLDFAGTLDLALAAYEAARSLSPDDREIRSNHGMVLLRAGRLAEGWTLFESRRRQRDPVEAAGIARLPAPLDGVDLKAKRILLFHEQGFGDSIQFLRYVPMLARRGAEILVRMPPELARLAAGTSGIASVLTDDQVPERLDFWSPMMSLALSFGTTLDTMPAPIRYPAPPAALARWQAALARLPQPRIGLVWAGSPRGGLDRRRSMRFADLLPLFGARASFVSLQLGEAARHWAPPAGVRCLDPGTELDDFAETAALIAALDLVIAVDTAVAHVAGAVGTPIWVMSRFSSCWRWLTQRDDSPWYPTLTLFRQARPGDWAELVARVAAALERWCRERPSTTEGR